MNRYLSACALCLLVSGCHLLTPPDPPLEDPVLRPDGFAWDEFDIAQAYTYIDVPRIDCSQVESLLSGSGKCVPIRQAIGKLYECPLEAPATTLWFGCFSDEELPAVYVRFNFEPDAKNIDFSPQLGTCQVTGAGPAAGQSPRYPTDIGFKACLFTAQTTPGKVVSLANTQIPTGMFVDLTDNPESLETLMAQAAANKLNAPLALVLDARYLDHDGRIQAFKDLEIIFGVYRALNPEQHIKPAETIEE